MSISLRSLTAAALFGSLFANSSAAQTPNKPVPACGVKRALGLGAQQLSEAKALENGAQRSAVLTRAAELLWAYDEARARALFADAFEIASAHYGEHGQESIQRKPSRPDAKMSGLTYSLPDPRLTVIRAVSPRDPAWAQKLATRAAEETQRRAADASAPAPREGGPGDRLLWMARSLMPNDTALAVSVARQALRHPASRYLSEIVYETARADRAAADALYLDALRAYSGADVPSLLSLSAYPFGLSENLGLRYGSSSAGLPPRDFAPRPELQRQFVSAFLQLAARRLGELAGQPPPQDDPANQSEVETIYSAIRTLDYLYAPSDRSYVARATPLREAARATLTEGLLRRAEGNSYRKTPNERTPDPSSDAGFLERVLENAERTKDPDRHDLQIVTGLQPVLRTESVEHLEAAAEKIKDEMVRRQFRDLVYFERALKETKEGRLEEAARFAEKVESLEQRSVLAGEVAAAELKAAGDPLPATRAASLAESVYKSAQPAPESEEKAHALLALTHVYAKLDPTRAPVVLYEAIAVANRLPGLDLTRSFLTRAVEGKGFNFYAVSIPAPGFSLATVLRELAERDFETALTAAGALDDRYERALAVLGLAARCLEGAPPPEKSPAAKKAQPAAKSEAAPVKRP